MTEKKSYPGINIQWPYSEWILEGKKTIETRSYPIPPKYLGKEMVLIETPGKKGHFKARMRGVIVFTQCFMYENETSFYLDQARHLVIKKSDYSWNSKCKWGWVFNVKAIFPECILLEKRHGVKFTNDVFI